MSRTFWPVTFEEHSDDPSVDKTVLDGGQLAVHVCGVCGSVIVRKLVDMHFRKMHPAEADERLVGKVGDELRKRSNPAGGGRFA